MFKSKEDEVRTKMKVLLKANRLKGKSDNELLNVLYYIERVRERLILEILEKGFEY